MAAPWRPNILFLLVDCLRADYLYRYRRARHVRTPTLSRLARGGLHCTQMIAAATTTTPCVASIFTGTYSVHHGIRSLRGYRLRPDLTTLAGNLQQAGYHTHAEVTGPLLPAVALDRGFTSYEYREEDAYLDTPWGETLVRRLAGGNLPAPWFAFVHLWELHLPRRVTPPFDSRRFGRNQYERALSSLDAQLVRLLSALDDDVLIVVHGDHGEQLPVSRRRKRFYRWQRKIFGRQFPPWPSFPIREGHGFDVWEDLIRVPLVLHHSNRIPARRVPHLTRQVDIMPTLLDILGLPAPTGIDGVSLLPAALGGPVPQLDAHIEACGESIVDPRDWRRGTRTARWKYIQTVGGTRPEELYDLERDPRERRNVAAREPQITTQLRSMLAARLGNDAAAPASRLTAEDERLLDAKLRDLGYIE